MERLLGAIVTSHELSIKKPVIRRIIKSYKIRGSIVFAVEAETERNTEERFVPYGLMRDHYARDMLLFLEKEGKILL